MRPDQWTDDHINQLRDELPDSASPYYYVSAGADLVELCRLVIAVAESAPTYVVGGGQAIGELMIAWVDSGCLGVLTVEADDAMLRAGRLAHSFFGAEIWRLHQQIANNEIWLIADDEVVFRFVDCTLSPDIPMSPERFEQLKIEAQEIVKGLD